MAHYYAFCEKHKKVGPDRSTPQAAANDAAVHLAEVPGPHGHVYVKESNLKIVNGIKKFNYKKHRI